MGMATGNGPSGNALGWGWGWQVATGNGPVLPVGPVLLPVSPVLTLG